IDGFHLRDTLDLVSKRLPGVVRRFGGHAYAAGLSIAEKNFGAFAETFEALGRETLTPAHLKRTVASDGSLAAHELRIDLAKAMRDQVWGQGFPAPLFDDPFESAEQRVIGGKHLRLQLLRDGVRHPAILFNRAEPLPPRLRAAYRPEIEE